MPTDLSLLLLPQWQDSPRVRGIVTDILTPLRDSLHDALSRFEAMLDLDSAEGVWLDWIGARIGLPRPATAAFADDAHFGFDSAGVGFDQAPFAGAPANDATSPLADPLYRLLLRARRVALRSDGTTAALIESIRELDAAATVQDQRDMSVRVVTGRAELIRLADAHGAVARNGGVRLIFADRERFGFGSAGVGFDLGPFAGN